MNGMNENEPDNNRTLITYNIRDIKPEISEKNTERFGD